MAISVILTFNSTAYDVSDYVVKESIELDESLFTNLSPNTSACKLKLSRSCPYLDEIFKWNDSIQIAITNNGVAAFTGYLTDDPEMEVSPTGIGDVEISAEDPGIKLLKRAWTSTDGLATVFNGPVCDGTTPSTSFLHTLAALAGVTLSSTPPTISGTVNFSVADTDEDEYWDILEGVLSECLYTFYFNAAGELCLYALSGMQGTPTDYVTTQGTILSEGGTKPGIVVKKRRYNYREITVEFDETETIASEIVFKDTTNQSATHDCVIPLSPGEYYPPTCDTSTYAYIDYFLEDKRDLVSVASAASDFIYETGIVSEFTHLGKRARVRFYNGAATQKTITQIRVVGASVVAVSSKSKQICGEAGKAKKKVIAKYIHAKADALALGNLLYYYYKNSASTYEFRSYLGSLALGDIVNIADPLWTGLDVNVVITGKKYILGRDGATYTAEGVNTINLGDIGTCVPVINTPQRSKDGVSYALIVSAASINKNNAGIYTPAAIDVSATITAGVTPPAAYSGRFVISTTTDGVNFTAVYTSAADEATHNYTIPANISAIRVQLYVAGGVADLITDTIVPITSDGLNGGQAGQDARTVALTAGTFGVTYETSGLYPQPTLITLTATAAGTAGAPYYEFLVAGVSMQNTTSNTYNYSPPVNYADMPVNIECRLREGADGGTVLARDQVVIVGLRAGTHGVTSSITNPGQALPASNAGVVSSYAGSGCTIRFWEGGVPLYYYTALAEPAANLYFTEYTYFSDDLFFSGFDAHFVPGTPTVSPAGAITVGALSGSLSTGLVVGDHSAMSSSVDMCVITYPITVRKIDGTDLIFSLQQTITKSKAGATGPQGPQGSQGTQGPAGADGHTNYFHVAYATAADGSAGFNQSSGPYIGTYVDETQADSGDYHAYTWRRFVGLQGDQGVPGVDGKDGVTYYLHIAYANSADGTSGFSTTDGTGKLYLGQCVDTTLADPTTPSSYTWTLIKGDKGDKGDTGASGTAPKNLGRYDHVHPASYNPGDWWVVYDTDDSPIQRGIWYDNAGTPARISAVSSETGYTTDAVLLAKLSACMADVAWCEKNGYGTAANYGIAMFFDSFGAVTAFIQTLFAQNIVLGTGGSISSPDYAAGSAGLKIGADGNAEFNNITARGTFVGGLWSKKAVSNGTSASLSYNRNCFLIASYSDGAVSGVGIYLGSRVGRSSYGWTAISAISSGLTLSHSLTTGTATITGAYSSLYMLCFPEAD